MNTFEQRLADLENRLANFGLGVSVKPSSTIEEAAVVKRKYRCWTVYPEDVLSALDGWDPGCDVQEVINLLWEFSLD